MEPKYSPEDHLSKLIQSWIGTILIIGAILFPVLEFMDYFISPLNFTRFMVYRLIISAILVIFYYLNRLKRSKAYQYSIAVVTTALCAITIEIAILQSGGQNSIYYAAMLILSICCLGFVPFNMPLSFILTGIIYGIYVVPIALTETIGNGAFVSNNAFLISTFVIGLLLRYHNQKLIVTELQLRAELSEDKRKLELYSDSLKDQVREKTGKLELSEQKYRGLFDNANDGIAVLDAGGNITDVNYRFCELHGFDRESILGANFRLLEVEHRPGEIDERLKRTAGGEALVYEAEHYRKNGSRIFFEISSKAIDLGGARHIQSFHRDITDKKKLQEQVLQSQKMESMGVLAGGIAHDFNNVLTAILGHTEVLRRRIGPDEFNRRRIKTIEDAAKRAGQMVSKLLSFARKESLELAPTDLNAVVRDTIDLLGRTLIDRNINARVETAPALPAVNADSIHLEQVITNLVMNSMDAMPRGGTITISTSTLEFEANPSRVHPYLREGKYALLSVSDTGEGIPPELMDRIFDPFFTTKPVGKGTGLGLAMVYGIVKSHKGEVRVKSEVGAGTTFEIYLPALDKPVKQQIRELKELPLYSAAGSESILVVDDEKDVLSYMKDTLDSHGYKVFVADNPVYAQDLFKEISGSIDLIVTDLVMPLMNGVELIRQFREIKPEVKVIGMSGFKGGSLVNELRDIYFFIKKPFDSAVLLTAVRQALDAKKEDG